MLQGVEDIFVVQFEEAHLDANDNACHGACLAIAELIRRGLVPTESLQTVIPAVLKVSVF